MRFSVWLEKLPAAGPVNKETHKTMQQDRTNAAG
jgi:hypothetical protein